MKEEERKSRKEKGREVKWEETRIEEERGWSREERKQERKGG